MFDQLTDFDQDMPGTDRRRDLRVLALFAREALPYACSTLHPGLRVDMLSAEAVHDADAELRHPGRPVDVLVVDEDYFGDPELTAAFCRRARRFSPEMPIIALASEMNDGNGCLRDLGLADVTLSALPQATALTRATRFAIAEARHQATHSGLRRMLRQRAAAS